MSDISEAYHTCQFVPGSAEAATEGLQVPIDGTWSVCARPSELCLAALGRIEDKIAATKRLRELADLCGNSVLDLSRLKADDILHLYAAKPGTGYGQAVGRHMSISVRELAELSDPADSQPVTIVRGNVVQDTYNNASDDKHRELAVPLGSDISLLGSWKERQVDPRTSRDLPAHVRFGLLVVGSLAVYEISKEGERHAHGVLLQEVALTDPSGVEAVMWDTDPLTFADAPDFLGSGWRYLPKPETGTLDG